MNDIYTVLYYVSGAAVLLAAYFAWRGLRLAPVKIICRYFIPLILICLAVTLWPKADSTDLTRILALIAFLVLTALVLYDIFLSVAARFKKGAAGRYAARYFFDYAREIFKALQFLAMQGTGALVIIEGKEDLEPCLSGGIPFDSDIRAEVLIALFSKESPVHDGGVIVRRGRVAKIKSILPLTENASLSTQFGTRHRAAIGVSEVTDSIVFVVSEERGTICVAYRGSLINIKSWEHMEQVLRKIRRRSIFGMKKRS